MLNAIAEATHGSYQPLGVLGEGMNRIRLILDSTPDLKVTTNTRKLGVDRFQVFVAVVLILLVAESLIGTRRKLRESPSV